MGAFYERRPKFKAEQFDGTSGSVLKIRHLYRAQFWNIASGPEGSVLTLGVAPDSIEFTLNEYDWLVTQSKSDGTTTWVESDAEFVSRYEAVQ